MQKCKNAKFIQLFSREGQNANKARNFAEPGYKFYGTRLPQKFDPPFAVNRKHLN